MTCRLLTQRSDQSGLTQYLCMSSVGLGLQCTGGNEVISLFEFTKECLQNACTFLLSVGTSGTGNWRHLVVICRIRTKALTGSSYCSSDDMKQVHRNNETRERFLAAKIRNGIILLLLENYR